ncbi:MAG: DNA replication/repair protein RecF [Actinomycetota bacterium]
MQVGHLELEDFRNYRAQGLELVDGLNLMVGHNAQGKTNLLEAVHCLSGLGSPRAPDAALVREGAERALLHAEVTRSGRRASIDIEMRPGRGLRALVNKNPIARNKILSDIIVSVFFGPDELSLVKGSPDGRRRFLDELVVKMRPVQDSLRRELERVLKQRNAQLKSMRREGSTARSLLDPLAVWDEQLTKAGAALAAARLKALAALMPFSAHRYLEIAGGGGLIFDYVSSWLDVEAAAQALADPENIDESLLAKAIGARIDELRQREVDRGQSLVGPQRDDVIVSLQTSGGSFLEARTYASQGDQRTAALALKLGEHDLLTEVLEEPPVLLLDDVFSELDPSRRGWLREAVRSAGQTLLSTAETQGWQALHAERAFEVSKGSAKQIA